MKLATRIAVGTSAVVVVMGLLTMATLHPLVRGALRRQSTEDALVLTRLTAERLADPLLEASWVKAQSVLDDLVSSSPSVAYAYVIDPMNRRVLHTFPRGLPREIAAVNRLPTDGARDVQWRVLETEKGIVQDVAVRVIEGLDGELHVGFAEAGIASSVRQVAKTTALLTLLGVCVGTAVALGVGRRISRPLETVTAQAGRLAEGRFTTIPDAGATDEVGDLARAFNSLSRSLDSTMAALQRRNRELSAGNAVATAAPDDVVSALQRALAEALGALGLDVGWIVLREDSAVRVVAACGGHSESLTHVVSPRQCACVAAISSGQPVRLSTPPLGCFAVAPSTAGDVQAHAAVPIMVKGRVFGALVAASGDEGGVRPEDISLLNGVARQMGMALESARLWRELETKERLRAGLIEKLMGAQEEERRRIARELHDETGQTLNSLVLGLRAAEQMLAANSPAALAHVTALKKSAAECVRELQHTIYDLRPSVLDDLGLIPSLRWLLDHRFAGRDMEHVVRVDGEERRLPRDIETALFRIAQEAVTNIARHASARNVAITLRLVPGEAGLEIADDGAGFDPDSFSRPGDDGRGLGLLGIRERVEILGGHSSIQSRAGLGTRVCVRVPVAV